MAILLSPNNLNNNFKKLYFFISCKEYISTTALKFLIICAFKYVVSEHGTLKKHYNTRGSMQLKTQTMQSNTVLELINIRLKKLLCALNKVFDL